MPVLWHHFRSLLPIALLLLQLSITTAASAEATGAKVLKEWAKGVANHDVLFSGTETDAQLLPVVGNGALSWQIDSPCVFISGLYLRQGGDETLVRRARLPSQLSILPEAASETRNETGANNTTGLTTTTSTFLGEALDMRTGSFSRRRRFTRQDESEGEVVVEVEQRWYAHRSFHSVLAMEIRVTTTTPEALAARPLELRLVDTSVAKNRKGKGGGEEGGREETSSVTVAAMAATGEVGKGGKKVAENATNCNRATSTSSFSSSRNGDENQDVIFEDLSSQHPGLRVYRGILHAPENTSTTTLVSLVSTPLPPSLLVRQNHTWHFLSAMRSTLKEGGKEGGKEDGDPLQATLLDHRLARGMAPSQELFELHKDGWKQWWSEVGVEVQVEEGREEGPEGWLASAVNSSFYTLGSTARDDWAFGVGRGGGTVVVPGEEGRERGKEEGQHVMWDMEVYIFPALLLFNPSWACSLIEYRFARLAAAVTAAAAAEAVRVEGVREGGETRRIAALFPWESAGTGEEVGREEERREGWRVHVSGAVAWAVWQYWFTTQDEGWMEEVGFPLLKGVANLWVARAEERREGGREGGTMHLCGVIPPDEKAGVVDDSAYVNGLTKLSLGWASKARRIVRRRKLKEEGNEGGGQEEQEEVAWERLRARLVIPFDKDRGIHPEYSGYVNAPISQADVVLLGYPLGFFTPPSLPPSPSNETDESRSTKVRAADLAFYRARFQEGQAGREEGKEGGLTWGMHVVSELDVGRREEAQAAFGRAYEPYCQHPFGVWTEGEKEGERGGDEGSITSSKKSSSNNNSSSSISSSSSSSTTTTTTNNSSSSNNVFLPAAGGFLQALVQGYGGLRLLEAGGGREGGSMLRVSPACPAGVCKVKYRHLVFLGNHFSFAYSCSNATKKRRMKGEDEEKKEEEEEEEEEEREEREEREEEQEEREEEEEEEEKKKRKRRKKKDKEKEEEDGMTLTLSRTELGAPSLALVFQKKEGGREGGQVEHLPLVAGNELRVSRQEAFLVVVGVEGVER